MTHAMLVYRAEQMVRGSCGQHERHIQAEPKDGMVRQCLIIRSSRIQANYVIPYKQANWVAS